MAKIDLTDYDHLDFFMTDERGRFIRITCYKGNTFALHVNNQHVLTAVPPNLDISELLNIGVVMAWLREVALALLRQYDSRIEEV